MKHKEEKNSIDFCTGPLGCEGRICDPKMEDCQGCLKDAHDAMNEVPTQEEQEYYDWYFKSYVDYKGDEPPLFDV